MESNIFANSSQIFESGEFPWLLGHRIVMVLAANISNMIRRGLTGQLVAEMKRQQQSGQTVRMHESEFSQSIDQNTD